MDIEGLEALLAVMAHGSFAAAAEASGTARTTLRRRIETLEARVGYELFLRDQHGAEPTAAARALADRARPLLEQLLALSSGVREDTDVGAGSLHLLAPVGMPPGLLAMGLLQARLAFPGLSLELSVGDLEAGNLSPEIDIALHFGPAPPRGPYLTTTVLRIPERLLASPDYLESHGQPGSIAELQRHTLLSWRPPGEDGRSWPLRSGDLFRVAPVVVSPDIHVVRTLAAAGQGIALVPDADLAPGLGVDGLVPVLEGEVGRECAMRVVVPEARAELSRTRKGLDLLRQLMRNLP